MSHILTRREAVLAGAAAASLAVPATAAPDEARRTWMQKFTELFELSMKEKKGIMLYLAGQTVGGGVLRYDAETVELRNQQYSRIIVRIDKIEAVAGY